eukprot:TRINITY_DN4254_c0_g1_i1.p1 TRINITY_DN4254_c0_g1~~TRINITY_DN4254_c0_g1_i1.p1  ORF type:complete len:153 (+),score=27.70 TRINITY_DN4254_c0_g1_i1:59-517(+)
MQRTCNNLFRYANSATIFKKGTPRILNTSRSFASYTQIRRVTPYEFVKSMEELDDFYILDVRTPDEFKQMRVSGSLSYPLEDMENKVEKLDKSYSVYIHCDKTEHSEPAENVQPSKSLQAANILLAKGFSDVNVLQGGPAELKNAGFAYYTA